MAPQSCNGIKYGVEKLQRWEYSTPREAKLRIFYMSMFVSIRVHAWIDLLLLLLFFSLHSQWRVPGVSDDNITWLPTKAVQLKR